MIVNFIHMYMYMFVIVLIKLLLYSQNFEIELFVDFVGRSVAEIVLYLEKLKS